MGDADLYLSTSKQHPTFDYGDHDLSSTTCGLDGILLPKSLKKPVYVGVYGHPRFEVRSLVTDKKITTRICRVDFHIVTKI